MKIFGTTSRPRLAVFRSNLHIYAQIIDDEKRRTLLVAQDSEISSRKKLSRKELSREVGKLVAKKAKEQGITSVVFDRGGYLYHGNVKELAEGAREGGLVF